MIGNVRCACLIPSFSKDFFNGDISSGCSFDTENSYFCDSGYSEYVVSCEYKYGQDC